MIRLGNPFDFHRLPYGEDQDPAVFTDTANRRVRMTFNAPAPTAVYISRIDATGQVTERPMLLAVVHGLQPVEFSIASGFIIEADADIWLKTDDGSVFTLDLPEEVSLVRPYEARSVDPAMQRMQEMLLRDQDRRLGAIERAYQAQVEALLLGREASDAGAPPGGVAASEPVASGGGAGPAEPAPAPAGTVESADEA